MTSNFNSFLIAAGAAALALVTSPSAKANLLENGGFELGVYNNGSYGSVPADWIANAGFAFDSFGNVVNVDAHSGTYALQIGD